MEADSGESPCAKSPAMIPAKTSPVPAVAKDGFANGLMKIVPVGVATMVLAPLRIIKVLDSLAIFEAMFILSEFILSMDKLVNLENSAKCGVKIVSRGKLDHQTLPLAVSYTHLTLPTSDLV